MRLLYGVAGEGMGHATRSKVCIDYLRSRGHEVLVATSGRAYKFLSRVVPNVTETVGWSLAYRDGALDLLGARDANAAAIPSMIVRNSASYMRCMAFGPRAVVSDCDPFSHFYAKSNGLRVMCVDNIQAITRCVHDGRLVAEDPHAHRIADAATRILLLGCDRYVVTTFFYPPIQPSCAANTVLVPPIVRPEVLAARPSDAGHVLVYQTAAGDGRLLATLATQPRQRFVVYGLDRDETVGNCRLRRFDDRAFVEDMAGARAVIANGGMSTMGEALALGKPFYSVPVRGHFEQAMNAFYLEAMGFGSRSRVFDPATLAAFLGRVPAYAARIRACHVQDGNRSLYRELDGFLSGNVSANP